MQDSHLRSPFNEWYASFDHNRNKSPSRAICERTRGISRHHDDQESGKVMSYQNYKSNDDWWEELCSKHGAKNVWKKDKPKKKVAKQKKRPSKKGK